jgi:hypothetical protein
MKKLIFLLISTLLVPASLAYSAEKNKTLIQCDITRSAVETAAGKIEGNKEAAADLEQARTALKYADDCYKAGKSMFGFGDISSETEKEIKLAVDMADTATITALSRVELARATSELEAIEKQFTSVKAKLKLFEDRTAELVRLRLEVAAGQKTTKELEAVKAEKVALTTQVEQLAVERTRADKLKIEQLELSRKVEEMKSENTRLATLVEKQQAELKALPVTLPPVDDAAKKKVAKKP